MEKIYKFYLTHSEVLYEYSSLEIDKKEMEHDIVNNIFPDELYCMREKWIDGKMKYCNRFRLIERRQDPNYINNHRLYEHRKA